MHFTLSVHLAFLSTGCGGQVIMHPTITKDDHFLTRGDWDCIMLPGKGEASLQVE